MHQMEFSVKQSLHLTRIFILVRFSSLISIFFSSIFLSCSLLYTIFTYYIIFFSFYSSFSSSIHLSKCSLSSHIFSSSSFRAHSCFLILLPLSGRLAPILLPVLPCTHTRPVPCTFSLSRTHLSHSPCPCFPPSPHIPCHLACSLSPFHPACTQHSTGTYRSYAKQIWWKLDERVNSSNRETIDMNETVKKTENI